MLADGAQVFAFFYGMAAGALICLFVIALVKRFHARNPSVDAYTTDGLQSIVDERRQREARATGTETT